MKPKDEKLKLNPVIYEEAADWIVELRESEVDAAMRERLDAWFRTSPEHIKAYLELSSIWEEGADPDLDKTHTTEDLIALVGSSNNIVSLVPGPVEQVGEINISCRSGVAEGSPKTLLIVPKRENKWRPLGRRTWLSVGTAACLAAALALYFYRERNVTFATEIGEQRFEKLIDGSTIELNSKSLVRIRYSDHERNVDLLEGQALFHVAKDASRPFIVHSESTLVRAVGTQFDVYRKPAGTVVTVVEGRVAALSPWLAPTSPPTDTGDNSQRAAHALMPNVRSGEAGRSGAAARLPAAPSPARDGAVGTLFLSAGEQVTVAPSESQPRLSHADTATVTAWTQHELVFESTPLTEVAQEFNRYNTRPLIVDDPALVMIHITGIFSSSDPSALIKFLRTQRDLDVLESDRDIRIEKK